MRRLLALGALLATMLATAAAVPGGAGASTRPVSSAPQLVAFRGFHFSGGGFGRRRYGSYGFGGRRRGSSHLLRRVGHALVFAYILHLFFSHGGFSILVWLVVIGLIVHFMRRRRRRYA